MKSTVILYVISDAIGETAQHLIRASTAQFTLESGADIRRHAFVRNEEALFEILEEAKVADAIVVQTLVQKRLALAASVFCEQYGLPCIDLVSNLTAAIEQKTGQKSKEDPATCADLTSIILIGLQRLNLP